MAVTECRARAHMKQILALSYMKENQMRRIAVCGSVTFSQVPELKQHFITGCEGLTRKCKSEVLLYSPSS